MLKQNDKQIFSSVKDSLLELGKGAINKGLLDYLFVTSGITATAVSAPISIPLIAGLFVAYAGINYSARKNKNNEQKILNDEFIRKHKEIIDCLRAARKTRITELTKIIGIEIEQKKQRELIEFLIEKIDGRNAKIDDICKKICFNRAELGDVQDKLNNIITTLDNVNNTTTQTRKKIDEYQEENRAKFDKVLEIVEATQKAQNQSANSNISMQFLCSIFNISLNSMISTEVDDDFDKVINIISNKISQNKIAEALEAVQELYQDEKYNDKKSADVWLSALRGQALLIAGKKEEALEALAHSELQLGVKEPCNALLLIYANGYIYKNQKAKALEIVSKIRENTTNGLSLDATALWIAISDLPFHEIEEQLSDTEKDYYKIAEALACKARDEELYGPAEKYARNSIIQSKLIHRQPCVDEH